MSLQVTQIKKKIKELYEPHLNLSDIGLQDKDRENKILSRCLAALAVQINTNATPKEAAEAVIDDGDDNGIDAIYFDPTEKEVILAQAKWINSGSGEPEAKDVSNFIDGIKDIIENNQEPFRKEIHPKIEGIWEKISTPGVLLKIVLATTGSSTLAKHSTQKLERLESELNSVDSAIASHVVIGLSETYNFLSKDLSAAVEFTATIENWHSIDTPNTAYYGTIDGLQLKKIWSGTNGRIISANIRGALGDTEVNNKIRKTALEEPHLFWYYNNGVTFTASNIDRAAANTTTKTYGTFKLTNPSVVNGAQTISTLSKIDDDAALERLRVSVRFISLEGAHDDFGSTITRSNNFQNRIEGRDFVAQDTEQHRIQKEMYMEGIEYKFIRDSEESTITETSCTLIEATISLACASGDSNLAVAAKTGTGRFFIDLTKAPYKAIFNPQTNGSYTFNTITTLRSIDNWIKQKIKDLPKKSGSAYGTLVHGNRIIAAAAMNKLGKEYFKKTITDFKSSFDEPALHTILGDVHQKITDEINNKFQGKFLAVLFKSPGNSKIIYEAARN
ncbi:AIPR family protein [Pseudomonas sp. PDM15]|uniref:AIPR family protein n=1 Tax=Pseudomonas sp. PDM15 TaxID=2769303 RepID=UPI001783F76D|nr:AIPR family protein [Pseudomonas sp. PDM15]MBD9424800.1 AIPR family protein [Pseudomonas sp. PDM15]